MAPLSPARTSAISRALSKVTAGSSSGVSEGRSVIG